MGHLEQICKKTYRTTNVLTALMPNVGGPRSSRRRLMLSTVNGIIRYAAPTWAPKLLGVKVQRNRLRRVNRVAALRVATSAFCTVGYDAACVIAGTVPVALLVFDAGRGGRCRGWRWP